MALQSNIELIKVLKSLVPINNLSKDSIALIAASSNVETYKKDYVVFHEGDDDEYVYYLLDGKLELVSTNNSNFHIVSGTEDARYPLAQFQPRQYTAKAITDSLVLIIDRVSLDLLLVGNKSGNTNLDNGLEVNDIDTNDWMSRILHSPLYTNIPVENIQKIFSKIETFDVKKGDVVINQGNDGEYYYIIQIGRCSISRKPAPTSQDINIAELKEGDAFGEEAIIANLKRNASVTMMTDGRLMRLGKNDFKELILYPILHQINFESAQDKVNKGAVWLDVRYPDEYQDYAIEGSLNIPLNVLRLQVDNLDSSRQYIACCDTTSRSSIAAYILAQHGYDVLHLNKGLKGLLRHEYIEKIDTQTQHKDAESTNALLFNNKALDADEHVLNNSFHDEISQLREELDIMRGQFQEFENFKDMASELKKSFISDTENKLKVQRERINLHTQNANKLIQHAQKMHKELREEKRLIYEEVDKHRRELEKTLNKNQDNINKRLLVEEKKMQAFYLWKEKEIAEIKELKRSAEQEYLAIKKENKLKKNNDDLLNQSQSLDDDMQYRQEHKKEEMNNDLKQWLGEQVKNELLPINQEVQNAKRRLIEQVNERAVKSKQQTKIHDQTLSSEIDTLLKGVEN